MQAVGERWRTVFASRAADPVLVDRVLDDLAARHRGRPHHHLSRVLGVLDRIDELDHRVRDPHVVRLAAWCATVEVDAGVPDRARCARWAADVLPPLGVAPAELAGVTALLGALVDHEPGEDADAAVLCDADLAVLGEDAAGYARHLDELRAEGGPGWPVARAARVRCLLRRDSVFRTPEMRAAREGRAQLNLAREAAGAGVWR